MQRGTGLVGKAHQTIPIPKKIRGKSHSPEETSRVRGRRGGTGVQKNTHLGRVTHEV